MGEDRFRIINDYADAGLYVRHSAYPECIIEVIELESQAMYANVAGLDDIFDLFNFNTNSESRIYMLTVEQYIEHDDSNDVPDQNVADYRRMLRKTWKWLLYSYLIHGNELPAKPRFISMNQYMDDDANIFSIEKTDDGIIITHRIYPIFRAKVEGNSIRLIDAMEDLPADPSAIAAIMRRMGDWYARLKL